MDPYMHVCTYTYMQDILEILSYCEYNTSHFGFKQLDDAIAYRISLT